MQSHLLVHNQMVRGLACLAVLSLASLIPLGCSDDSSRRLTGGSPGETSNPTANAGRDKSVPSTPSTPNGTATPPETPCPPEVPSTAACASTSFQAIPPPLGLYLMLDRSGSMTESTHEGISKWQALTQALQDFLQVPPVPSLSVAAQFFPANTPAICEPATYEQPAINLEPASKVKSALISTLISIAPEGTTPTGPALQGAITQARLWATKQPKTTFAIVLATDGMPSLCEPTSASDLQAVAAEGISTKGTTPSIPTFVVGILGVNDLGSGALTILDAIAQGGGTGKATRINPSTNLAQQMTTALRAVVNQRVACSFELPSSMTNDADLSKLNVILEGSCGRIELPYNQDLCTGDGWHYDVDPTHGFPRSVELCPVSCNRYRAGDKASLEFGCITKGWPTE